MTNGLSVGGGSDYSEYSQRINELQDIASTYNLNVPMGNSFLDRLRRIFWRPSSTESMVASNINLLSTLRDIASIREHKSLVQDLKGRYISSEKPRGDYDRTYDWFEYA